jgi:hypothetical protein
MRVLRAVLFFAVVAIACPCVAQLDFELACPTGFSPLMTGGKTYNSQTKKWRANFCVSATGNGHVVCMADGCFGNGGAALTSAVITNAGLFTNTQMNEYLQSLLHGCSPLTEYQALQGGGGQFSTDALTGCIALPAGATVHNANAVAGYVSSSSSTQTAGGGVSGGYFSARCLVTGSSCWGINPIISDTVGITTKLVGGEIDLATYGTPSYVAGLIITGIWKGTMPANNSVGLQIAAGPTSTTAPGVAIAVGEASSTVHALQIFPTSPANSSPSQDIAFVSRDSGGTVLFGNIFLDTAGDLIFGPSAGAFTIMTKPSFNTGVNPDGSGFKHKRVAGCATAASLAATCTTVVTWGSAFADANYTATCTGDLTTSGVPLNGGLTAKAGASVTFKTVSATAAAAQYTTIDCVAVHD